MSKPRICAALVANEPEAVKEIEPLVDLIEVRIDLIIAGWQGLVKLFHKPWLACNRVPQEGGRGSSNEEKRIEELLEALELGADIVDIELRTEKLAKIVPVIKQRAKCLISYHDLDDTPALEEMKSIVRSQLKAGADICKVVTTARKFEDNLAVLQLIREFPGIKLVSFCMGDMGLISRVLCPLVGGYFTYASIEKGKVSAPGQITVRELKALYEMMKK